MDSNAIDYRKELYSSFQLNEHEIREGGKNSLKTKIQWFVYVRREAIQHRLDDLFFMQWELTYNEPIVTPSFVSVTAAITINGIRKEYNGGARPKGKDMSEDTAKAAYTDAFKRCASMWGIGLYLQNTPQVWTPAYPEGADWKAKKAIEDQAWGMFADWFDGKPAPQQQQSPKPATPQPTQQPQNVTPMPPQSTDDDGTQIYTCERITVLPRKDGFQYIAHCDRKVNIVTYTREKYRAAFGMLVDGWNVEVTPKGKVIPCTPPIRLKARPNGANWELVEVLAS